jgi:hypothetical protein
VSPAASPDWQAAALAYHSVAGPLVFRCNDGTTVKILWVVPPYMATWFEATAEFTGTRR